MTVVGDRPTRGMRLRLVLGRGKRVYEGTATTPSERWDVRAEIAEDARVDVHSSAPSEIAEYARRVVRIAARDAKAEGTALPRVIQRWRAEKE